MPGWCFSLPLAAREGKMDVRVVGRGGRQSGAEKGDKLNRIGFRAAAILLIFNAN